jgi:hypothetical protein
VLVATTTELEPTPLLCLASRVCILLAPLVVDLEHLEWVGIDHKPLLWTKVFS